MLLEVLLEMVIWMDQVTKSKGVNLIVLAQTICLFDLKLHFKGNNKREAYIYTIMLLISVFMH